MSWAAKTYTFSPSTTIASAQVNQNFDDMVAGLNTAMPSGGIIIWSGSIASIPSGWYLCDGNNSTPNLQDKFIVGAGSTYAVNATGGEATHVLTEAEMPVHTHIQNSHYHVIATSSGDTSGAGNIPNNGTPGTPNFNSETTVATNQNAGSGDAHNNLPPYFALAYIMKS